VVSGDLKAHYDNYYQGQTEWRRLGALDKARNIVRAWSSVNGTRLPASAIEVGCGEGSVLEELAQRGWNVRGFDISSSGVGSAQGRGLTAEIFDGEHLPLGDQSVDLLVMTHVVEHLENPRLLIREAARVAKFVFVEVPLERHWRTKPNFVWTSLGHINIYDTLLIRHLLQSGGLTILTEFTSTHSLAIHRFRSAKAGSALWLIRGVLLRSAPPLARRLFTYHQSLMCSAEGVPG
jgi:SAM-dependent methyltransferase